MVSQKLLKLSLCKLILVHKIVLCKILRLQSQIYRLEKPV